MKLHGCKQTSKMITVLLAHSSRKGKDAGSHWNIGISSLIRLEHMYSGRNDIADLSGQQGREKALPACAPNLQAGTQ